MHNRIRRRSLLRACAAATLLVACAVVIAPRAQPRVADAVAISNATILTVTQGTILNGTIVLRNGRIEAIGANLPIPQDAEVVDGTGKFVTPGIVDCHSHIAADSINESGTTVSSMTGIEDVFNPTDINIYRDLAGGLTSANILHGSANPIGGKSFLVKLRWGKTRVEDFRFLDAVPSIKLALGENPKRPGAGQDASAPPRFPATRMGVEYVIRDAFTRARAYQQSWQEYERRRKVEAGATSPRRDLQLEPLVEVLEGRRLVHAHSYRSDEILMLIRVAEEFGFKISTFQHVLEGYKVAREIAAHGAGASTFADWWGYKLEAVDAIPHNAALMARQGVLVSINSDSAEHARRLNTEAAKTIKWGGLSEEEALALITINPARQLRVDQHVGSLEAGKDADVVVWNRHPLSSYAIVDRVFIDGISYYDRIADERRTVQVARRKEELRALERDGPPQRADDNGIVDLGPRSDGSNSNGARPGRDQASPDPATEPPGRNLARGVLAIVNAKIFPVTRPPIERGTIIIRNGLIDAVGAGIVRPAEARVVDVAGASVYPGFIDASSAIGLSEPGQGGPGDADEILDFNPQLRPHIAFHNDSDAIPVARSNGVTTVALTPGGGIMGGQIAVMNLDGRTWEDSTLKAPVGITFQFPSLPPPRTSAGAVRTFGDRKRARDQILIRTARQLDDARAYAAAGPTRRRDLILEALVPVVERRMPLFTRANTEREIRDAVAFADRLHVRIVITGGAEASLVAPLLKDKGVPVVLASVLSLPTREDLPHQASYATAAALERAGVKIAFSAGDAEDVQNVRQLPYHAARSVAWGLPHEKAIGALTADAADILSVASHVGAIEPGKVANLIVSQGDPLEARTPITHVIIAGREVSLENRQLALYKRYLDRR